MNLFWNRVETICTGSRIFVDPCLQIKPVPDLFSCEGDDTNKSILIAYDGISVFII